MANYIVFLDDPENKEFFITADNEKQALTKAKEKYGARVVEIIEDSK